MVVGLLNRTYPPETAKGTGTTFQKRTPVSADPQRVAVPEPATSIETVPSVVVRVVRRGTGPTPPCPPFFQWLAGGGSTSEAASARVTDTRRRATPEEKQPTHFRGRGRPPVASPLHIGPTTHQNKNPRVFIHHHSMSVSGSRTSCNHFDKTRKKWHCCGAVDECAAWDAGKRFLGVPAVGSFPLLSLSSHIVHAPKKGSRVTEHVKWRGKPTFLRRPRGVPAPLDPDRLLL
jgi:hypothetical protein